MVPNPMVPDPPQSDTQLTSGSLESRGAAVRLYEGILRGFYSQNCFIPKDFKVNDLGVDTNQCQCYIMFQSFFPDVNKLLKKQPLQVFCFFMK